MIQPCRRAAFPDPSDRLRASWSRTGRILFAALAIGGCEKISGLVGFGGSDLSLAPKPGAETAYRSLVEVSMPVTTSGGSSTSGIRIDLTLKVRTPAPAENGWSAAEAEVADGSQEVDGQSKPGALAGEKAAFKVNPLRAFDAWQGAAFPCGAELLEIALPGARVRNGAKWTVPTRRALLRHKTEAVYDRVYVFDGERKLGSEDAWHLSVSIAAFKTVRPEGGHVALSGSGEVWISKKDGRILRATEVLTGQMTTGDASKQGGKFAHGITVMDATLAPPRMASLLDTGGTERRDSGTGIPGSAGTASSGAGGKPGQVTPVPSATGAAAERLVFSSRATGIREVWSVSPDGKGKRCISGFDSEHWSPSLDPEGRTLACAARVKGAVNVWTIGLLAGERAALTDFGENADIEVQWCNSGQRAVFLRDGKLWSIHRDGFNLQSLPLSGRVTALAATNASAQVAVVTSELNQNKVVVVDVLNGSVRELSEGDQPSWSPDGSILAYRGTDTVMVVNADGSSPRQIIKGQIGDGPICWDPSGKRVAVAILEEGKPDVHFVDAVAKGAVTRVTFRGGVVCAVSPTADRVAYLLEGDLWVATADGKKQVRLTADGATELPVWWGKHYVP